MPDSLVRECDGFVVVHRWKNAANEHVGRCFDEYATLENAIAFYRGLGQGAWSDHEPIGIYAALGGIPVRAGLIPMEVINSTKPGRARNDIGRVYVPNSIEQCQARQRRRLQEEVA